MPKAQTKSTKVNVVKKPKTGYALVYECADGSIRICNAKMITSEDEARSIKDKIVARDKSRGCTDYYLSFYHIAKITY